MEPVSTAKRTLDRPGFYALAQAYPNDIAIIDPYRQLTWGEFNERVLRLADVLEQAGLERGDRIAMLMGNRSEFVEILCACLLSGIIVTPINWHYSADEVAYVVEDAEAKALIVDDSFADAAKGTSSSGALRLRMMAGPDGGEGFDRYEDRLARASARPRSADGEPGGYMLYTSGTTGRPKGVVNSLAPPGATLSQMMSGLAKMSRFFGVEPLGSTLITGPLYHSAPLSLNVMTGFNTGNRLIMMPRFEPSECLRLIREYGVTSTHMVPTMFVRLLRLSEGEKRDFDPTPLESVIHGAAPCPRWVKKAMIDWWGPVLYEYLGATEGGITVITSEEWLEHPGSVGKPLPLYTIEIRDDNGTVLGPNEVGTVYFRLRRPGPTFRYHKDEAKTGQAHAEPGVFTVGDIGRLDEEGYLYLTDRKTDMIISGGVNIYPAEVEQTLSEHPAVADVAVFGIPNDEWGEEVKAVVQLNGGFTPSENLASELIEYTRGRIAHFKCPRSVDFMAELPRHPTGKLYKRLLREPYWREREQRI
jgi:long-chain acyl-CoA synthetase